MTADVIPLPNYSGGHALMLQINRHPGWSAVCAQAEECGFVRHPDDKTHLTVVFFGRDLSPSAVARARQATKDAMAYLQTRWMEGFRNAERQKGNLEWATMLVPPAFIPVRLPGDIGVFRNRTASHVHAVAELSPALKLFRQQVLDRYHGKPTPFGSYTTHVTLAEGPAGSDLNRPAKVPPGITNARNLVLKLGKEREHYSFVS